jgi:Tol biopolymer transport system component
MKPINAIFAAFAATVVVTGAAAQTAKPTVRKIAEIGPRWISGIIETRNGRFIIYAAGDSIFIRDRRTGATTSAFGRATDAIVNSLGSSASGDRIVFVSAEGEDGPRYVWTLAIDTLNGRPIGAARRVGVIQASDPSLSPDGRRVAFAERNPNAGGIAGGAVRLYTMPSGGGDATLVTDMSGRGVIRVPQWSADGGYIYFQMYPPGPSLAAGPTLWRVAASGGRPDSLGRLNLFTDVSPDGRYLAMFPQGTNWQRTRRPQYAVTDVDMRTMGTVSLPGNTRPYSWSRTGQPKILAVQGDYPSSVKTLSLSDGA